MKRALSEEAQLYQISKVVGEDWARLGQDLGLEKTILVNMKSDDDTQAALQMLKAWRKKTPHGPLHYLPQLEETLQNIGRLELAAAVQGTYKEYLNGLQITEIIPETNEDKTWSLHLPGEGKYLCRRTDLGVVTPYPLHVTYRSVNWSDYSWPREEEWMPVGPLFSIQCENVEGPVDILLPHVLHLTEDTEITKDDLQVVHVVGDCLELLPVTELTTSHAVTRFKKGSKFGVVGKREKASSVSRNCLLMAFRSSDDSDLSTLKVYIVSNTKEMKENLKEDEKEWNFQPYVFKTCHLTPGNSYYLRGSVTNGRHEKVKISPKRLIFEDTLDNKKFYEPFQVEVTADIWMDNTSRLYLELLKETTDKEADETQPLSQLMLGRYKRSQVAEGVDSGNATPTELESVRPELDLAFPTGEESHLMSQTSTAGSSTDFPKSCHGAERIVVLLINDEYGTSKGEISTISRQASQILKGKAVVYVTVLRVRKEDQDAADRDGVRLIQPDRLGQRTEPTLDWLTYYHSVHFPNLPQDVTCIIGHADITDTAARNIKDKRYPRADLITFTHVIPEDTEYYKEGREAMNAGQKERDMLDKVNNAKAAFSVGKQIFDHFDTKYRGKNKPKNHFLFLPKPSEPFLSTNVRPGGQQKVVLSIGRVRKVEKLKGHDLAGLCLREVVKIIKNARWRVRGINEDDWETSKKILEDALNSRDLNPTLLPYGTQEEIRDDMMTAHLVLMPSRSEPFGLVGLEAIAVGIPVLISDKTGLAEMINDLIGKKMISAEHRNVIVETSVNDSDRDGDAERWAKRIVDVLKYSDYEFEKAARFKQELINSRYWEESHNTFLQACGIATAELLENLPDVD
ncbi:uncharacterized protein LOC144916462 [Branchiostoma floridae x Branchiostoma belcheri]